MEINFEKVIFMLEVFTRRTTFPYIASYVMTQERRPLGSAQYASKSVKRADLMILKPER